MCLDPPKDSRTRHAPPTPPASQRRHAAGWTRGLEEGGHPAPGLPFTGQVNRHQPRPLSSPGCCWLSERNFMPAWAVSAKARHRVVAGSTLTTWFRSEETWRFVGLTGEKGPLTKKKKKEPFCVTGAPPGSLEARHDPPLSCLLLFSRSVSANGHKPQVPRQLFGVWAAGNGRTPGLSPSCKHLTLATPAACLALQGAGGRAAQVSAGSPAVDFITTPLA